MGISSSSSRGGLSRSIRGEHVGTSNGVPGCGSRGRAKQAFSARWSSDGWHRPRPSKPHDTGTETETETQTGTETQGKRINTTATIFRKGTEAGILGWEGERLARIALLALCTYSSVSVSLPSLHTAYLLLFFLILLLLSTSRLFDAFTPSLLRSWAGI